MFIPTETGRWVSEHYERLARVVQDYDPQFELRWIPPEARTDPEAFLIGTKKNYIKLGKGRKVDDQLRPL